MLGQWRIVLRQAEEAVRGGRFDEALALTNRPDVSDHHQAVQLRNRLVLDLIARAIRRAKVDDLAGAIEDLDQAERFGAPPDSLAAARLHLADRVAEEVRADLDAGDPAKVLDRIEDLSRRKIGGPALRRSREIAEAWRNALAEARRGEFGRAYEQLDRAERLAEGDGTTGGIKTALAATRRDLDARQAKSVPQIEALYAALSEGQWSRVLSAAEAVLTAVPEHPAARQARSKAWQKIAVIGPLASAGWPQGGGLTPRTPQIAVADASSNPESLTIVPNANRSEPRSPRSPLRTVDPSPPDRGRDREEFVDLEGRFLLWVDAVGGYLVCMADRIVLGRAGAGSLADVPLMGDLARRHATLIRGGDGYVIQAHHDSFVNGKPVEGEVVLQDGDVIRLGSTVELEFRQPSPVSATARLDILSRHRLPLAVDGILLMADTCIAGDSPQAHIPAPAIKEPVVLYRQGGALWCRAPGAFEVDGITRAARAPLTLRSSVLGDGFSFGLEPLANQAV